MRFAFIATAPLSPSVAEETLVGQYFVLGLPHKDGCFRVGLGVTVWRIPPGAYQTGDRVQIIAAKNGCLQVERCGGPKDWPVQHAS